MTLHISFPLCVGFKALIIFLVVATTIFSSFWDGEIAFPEDFLKNKSVKPMSFPADFFL